jgi:Plant transposon protein
LEALCDYHLWLWHASFGYAGSLNNLNIFNLSPFLNSLLDVSSSKMEKETIMVPFQIGDNSFNQLFVLGEGIYPKYSRFVKGCNSPITLQQKKLYSLAGKARKDIEQPYISLQSRFKVMDRPLLYHSLSKQDGCNRTMCSYHAQYGCL